MKNQFYLIRAGAIIFFTISTSVTFGSIWRVNNSDNSADFQSVQAAINDDINVQNGDTLFIEGSAQAYSGFSVDKQLYIIGPGYFLGDNPKTSNSGAFAFINGDARFIVGSEGSVILGITMSSSSTLNHIDVDTDNITVIGCWLENGLDIGDEVNNLTILKCFFDGNLFRGSTLFSFQNLTLRNSIINGNVEFGNSSAVPRTFGRVENNLFLGDAVLTASTFRNNIWFPVTSSSINIKSGTVENNLVFNQLLGTENGNTGFSNSSEVFGEQTGRSFDEKWALDSSSAFKGTGTDGTDPGVFGGSNPYVLSGVPPLPVIYELNTSGYGNQTDGLPVTIKVRSN